LTREPATDHRKGLVVSSAAYRDQLKLYLLVKRSPSFSERDVFEFRETILSGICRQLSDLICGGCFQEARRILTALAGAGGEAAPLVSRVTARVALNVGRRASVKARKTLKALPFHRTGK